MPEEPAELTALLHTADDAFNRAEFAACITACDQVLMEAQPDSSEAKEATILRLHASEGVLLRQLVDAGEDAEIALPLLKQAEAKGLEFNLQRTPLNLVRQGLESQRHAQADNTARELLTAGDRLRADRQWTLAAEQYAAAAQTPEAGGKIVAEANKRLAEVQTAEKDHARLLELLQEARDLQAGTQYPQARTAIKSALALDAGDADAIKLNVELETQVLLLAQLETTRQQAAHALAADNLAEAENKLAAALQLAGQLRLDTEIKAIMLAQADIHRRLDEREQEVQTALQDGREAIQQGDWPKAIDHLKRAKGWAIRPASRMEAENLLSEVQTRDGSLAAAKRLMSDAVAEGSLQQRLILLREAKQFTPDDPDLSKLIENTETDIIVQAMADTYGEVDLGFDTPAELEQGRLDSSGKVLFDGIKQIIAAIGGEKAAPIVNRYREMFRRVAVQKLHHYIERYATVLLRQGRFANAAAVCKRAEDLWGVDWLLSATVEWVDMNTSKPISSQIPREALVARLKIVAEQRRLLEEVQLVYPRIESCLTVADGALSEGRFDSAQENYEEALKQMKAQTANLQVFLDGVYETTTRSLSETLRRRAQSLSAAIQQDILQAAQLRDRGELEPALEPARRAKENAPLILKLRQRFDEITPEARQEAWTADSFKAEAEGTYEQVKGYLDDQRALQAGHAAMNEGDYSAAEASYTRVAHWEAAKKEAQTWLGKLPKLHELKSGVERDLDAHDFQSALDKLSAIFGLDGRCDWAVEQQKTIRPLQATRRQVRLYLDQAREAMNLDTQNQPLQPARPPKYDSALRYIAEGAKILQASAGQDVPSLQELFHLNTIAEDGLALRQKAVTARQDMNAAFTRSQSRDDYEAIVEAASLVIADNPADGHATKLKKRAETILKLDHQIEDAQSLYDWVEAQKLVKEAQVEHPSSPYLSNRAFEIDQKFTKQQQYEELLQAAEAAIMKKDWGDALVKATRAAKKRKEDTKPRNYATQARGRLLEIINDNLDPARPLEPGALAAAELAVQALRQVDGERGLKDVLSLLERARLISRARQLLDVGDVEASEAMLKERAEKPEQTGDAELQTVYTEARFQTSLKAGRSALSPPRDYRAAAAALETANRMNPGDAEAIRLLQMARLESSLLQFEDSLEAADPAGARVALRDLTPELPRVKVAQELLDFIEKQMGEAHKRFESVELEKALELVDGVLTRQLRYPPAVELRREILDNALQRAEAAEADIQAGKGGDLSLALKWYKLAKDKGLDEDHRKGLEGERRVYQTLENIFSDLVLRANLALDNADLTEDQRLTLESELTSAMRMAPEKQRATMSTKLNGLKDRQGEISLVEDRLNKAAKELDAALHAETYDSAGVHFTKAENFLQNAIQVLNYSGRTRTRELYDQLNNHKQRREMVRRKKAEYLEAREKLAQPFTPSLPLTLQNATAVRVEEIQTQGGILLDSARNLNRDWKRLDAENVYRLREWNNAGGQDDFLENENRIFESQKAELGQMSATLQNALRLRVQARQQAQTADERYARSVSDEIFTDALNNWDEAAKNYQQAKELVDQLQPPLYEFPITQLLYSLCGPLAEECHLAARTAREKSEKVRLRLLGLTQLRQSADRNWENAINSLRDAEAALRDYKEIQKENPSDQQANERVPKLKEMIARHIIRRRVIALGIGGVFFLIFLGLAGWLVGRPGGMLNPYTPTSTLAPTLTRTPAPTLGPTFTPTLTPTNTPTLPPTSTSTATPSPSPTPIQPMLCTVEVNGWIRSQPSNQSVGVDHVERGQSVEVVNSITLADGSIWFEVFLSGGGITGYINSELLSCPTSPTP